MACRKCKVAPVYRLTNSNVHLCRSCFTKYFERKVFKTIKGYGLVEKGDLIGVACSGGKDSMALLYLLNKMRERIRDIEIIAIGINEGIRGNGKVQFNEAKKFCRKNKIKLKIYFFKKEFGKSMGEVVKRYKVKNPCSICGVLRRFLLNKYARKLGVSKLATGHNLDDEAQTILMNQFRRNIETSARLGPLTGVVRDKRFVRRVKPFYFMTEKEVASYAFLKGLFGRYLICPYKRISYRDKVRRMLNEFEKEHEGTKHSIVNSFMEILPLLKEEYKGQKISTCGICGEPSSRDVCKKCGWVKEFGLKMK